MILSAFWKVAVHSLFHLFKKIKTCMNSFNSSLDPFISMGVVELSGNKEPETVWTQGTQERCGAEWQVCELVASYL